MMLKTVCKHIPTIVFCAVAVLSMVAAQISDQAKIADSSLSR